jgi:hypothetical protein
MPTQTPGKKPTVAIITSKYYEKLAVDAMMDDKTTFVKYKTEGKSFVFRFTVVLLVEDSKTAVCAKRKH